MKAINDKKIAVGFLAAFMVLGVVRFISYSTTTSQLARAQSIATERTALGGLRQVWISIQEAETGQRGYLLTGDERYLKPYVDAVANLQPRLDRLKQTSIDDPTATETAAQITRLARQKFDELAETLHAYKADGPEAAIAMVRSDRGQNLMDQLRELINRQIDRRNAEIDQRTQAVARQRRSGLLSFATFTALDYVMLVTAFYFIRRYSNARDQAERRLLESNTLQRAILDGVNTSIISVSPDGIVRTFNRTAQRWLGYSAADVVGKSSPPSWHDERDMRERAEQLSEQLGRTIQPGFEVFVALARLGGADEREWTYVAKDGRRFPVRLSVTALRDEASGVIVGFVGIAHDITQQKRVQQAILEAKEAADSARAVAEDASRTKSLFLANMSHELRTPLNAIIGYSEMLAEDAQSDGRGQVVADLHRINGAGKHLLALINDVLDLSKVEAGKTVLHVEPFTTSRLLDDVLATLRPMCSSNGNELLTEIEAELGAMRGDEMKLRQVLLNLLSNACKFTKHGTITLTARSIDDRRTMQFVVRDTGIGMTDAEQATLFQAFAQAAPSISVEYGGTGLGLAISREFCRLMGGDIEVISKLGEGTTFTVHVPRHIDPDRLPERAALGSAGDAPSKGLPTIAPRGGSGAGVVLVVDDDPTAQDLVRRALTADGFQVIATSSGADAIRLARETHPVAITLDVLMPGMDGWGVLTALKTDPDLATIPIVILSIVDDKAMAYAMGAKAFLTKPVDRPALSSVLAPYRRDGPQSVLIVEDDPASAELLRRAFELEGWRVRIAEDGAIGLDMLARESPTLITLDLMMPVLDGFAFISRLRGETRWASIPIIVVTAKELTPGDRARLSGGVQQVVQKAGVSRTEFADVVRNLVRNGMPGPAAVAEKAS